MCQEKRCKLQSVALLLICILVSAWSLVYKNFADADGIVTGALAFIVFAWISFALYKRKALPALEQVDMLFLLWMAYRWARMTGPLNFGTLSEDVLCIGLWMYFRMMTVPVSRKSLEWAVCLSAAVQVILVLLQWSGHLPSHHPEFEVTGTFGNPGPLGISLAMAMTIVMPRMVGSGRKVDVRNLIFLVLLGFALFLSDSRAAWLSVAVAACCLVALNRLKGRVRQICLAALPLAAVGLACLLYVHRPASADARLQIWKNVAAASASSPILGQGYGSFQSTYMDVQSAQLASQSKAQQWKADDVLAPYNEPLGYLYELGLVGFLLFWAFVVCAMKRLYAKYREGKACGLFVLVAYLAFSLFSYPSSISCLHVLVVACVASSLGQWKEVHGMETVPLVHVCSAGISALALFCLCLVPIRIHIQRTFSHLMNTEEQNVDIPLWLVVHDPHLLSQYTHVLLLSGDYDKAIPMLERQTRYVNTSRLQMDLAGAYEEAGNVDKALLHYRRAHVLRPGLIEPVYAQFCLYKDSNRNKALSLARECIDIQPKVKNRVSGKTRLVRVPPRRQQAQGKIIHVRHIV